MSSHLPKEEKRKITFAIVFFLALATAVFAQGAPPAADANRGYIASGNTGEIKKETVLSEEVAETVPPELQREGKLTEFQAQARAYRAQGLRLQNLGNLAGALSFYQKAIELDPSYAVAYNDLGIVYESAGVLERAEESYLKAIKADPNYLSSYTNLALFYEGKRDLDRAAFYWKKRVELGNPDDPWTKRAKDRLNDLAQVSPHYRQMVIESETISLMRKVTQEKLARQREGLKQAAQYYAGAKDLYRDGNYQKAMESIEKSLAITPQDKERLALRAKIQQALAQKEEEARVRQRKENARRMREYFEYGMRDYQKGNTQAAALEFNRIIELTESPRE
jgi:tetratricopeptide (TPR) repeat protein